MSATREGKVAIGIGGGEDRELFVPRMMRQPR